MATIGVMSGGAPKEVFTLLTPQYEKQSGHTIAFSYAVMTAIKEKLAAGEMPDILVMPVPLLDGLMNEGKVRAQGRATLGLVGISVVVREGAPKLDISTPEKFRQTLLDARAVVHATPGATPSGTHMGKLIEQLAIAAAMKSKIIHRPALDGGVQLVATGEADLGIYPTSEIVNIAGLAVAGPLPAALQLTIVYGAAVTTASAAAEPAMQFLKYLTDPTHRAQWAKAGFQPPAV